MRHRMLSPNMLIQSPSPVVRRQLEAALLNSMPDATLYEATDWVGAETLAEEHDMDIMLLTLDDITPPEYPPAHGSVATLADMRRLQPDSRFILLTWQRLPRPEREALAALDISPVSLRHLAPTLLRPLAPDLQALVHPDFDVGAIPVAQWGDRATIRLDG